MIIPILRPMAAALVALTLTAVSVPANASNFACEGHEFSNTMPSIEGRDGFFFRTFVDLRMQHPLTDQVVDQLGRLSDALARNGTTLIFAVIPTKSQAMPDYLPARAADYGYDSAVGTAVYTDIITRLRARGITAPDIQTALRRATPEAPPFFRADFHWTSEGARLAAEEIGAAIKDDPAYETLTPSNFESRALGDQVAFSGMRRALQTFCREELPQAETVAYVTEEVTDPDPTATTGALDIFGGTDATAQAVLVGTSFSDSDINNFAGFLSEYSGVEVVNYAITGGNQFGAITSYLTSSEFIDQPPRFLIWENPIYNNLAQYGPGHIDELVAAASGICTEAVATTIADPLTLHADVATLDLRAGDVILANIGQEGARRAEFSFQASTGIARRAVMRRGDRLRATGRFYQALTQALAADLAQVSVRFDRPISDATSLTLCRIKKDDPS